MKFILPEANPVLVIVTVTKMDTRGLSRPIVDADPLHSDPQESRMVARRAQS